MGKKRIRGRRGSRDSLMGYRKPKLVVRTKLRPKGQAEFNVEIRLGVAVDMPYTIWLGATWMTVRDRERYGELMAVLTTLKDTIGSGYKIIQHRGSRWRLTTKVLLKKESDLYVIAMAHPNMIAKAYRYVDATPSLDEQGPTAAPCP